MNLLTLICVNDRQLNKNAGDSVLFFLSLNIYLMITFLKAKITGLGKITITLLILSPGAQTLFVDLFLNRDPVNK